MATPKFGRQVSYSDPSRLRKQQPACDATWLIRTDSNGASGPFFQEGAIDFQDVTFRAGQRPQAPDSRLPGG